MIFRSRHLLLVLILVSIAGAEPAAQPATQPAEPPPVIKGEVVGRVLRAEDINIAVRSVRHQIVYDIVNGALTPAQQGPVPARLRCEVNMPPGLSVIPTYRSEVTAIEDDNANDLLKPFRGLDGKPNVGTLAGTIWNDESRQGPMWVEVPLPVFPRLPNTIARVAGMFTVSVPAEAKSYDVPLDKIGATAVLSDAVSLTLVSCNVEKNGVYEIKLTVSRAPGEAWRSSASSLIRSASGVLQDTPDGKKGNSLRAMDVSYTVDGVTVQFAPSTANLVKSLRLIVTTKTLEIPLQYDIRTRPMM